MNRPVLDYEEPVVEEDDDNLGSRAFLSAVQIILNENLNLKEELVNIHRNMVARPGAEESETSGGDDLNMIRDMFNALGDLHIYNEIHAVNSDSKSFKRVVGQLYRAIVKIMYSPNRTARDIIDLISDYLCQKVDKSILHTFPTGSEFVKVLQPDEFVIICVLKRIVAKVPVFEGALKCLLSKLNIEMLSSINLAQCRVYAAISKHLNRPHLAWQLCQEILMKKKKSEGPVFIASIGSVYPESLKRGFITDGTMDVNSRVMYHFILSQPDGMDQELWMQCQHVFITMCRLPLLSPFNLGDIFEILLQSVSAELLEEEAPDDPMHSFIAMRLVINQVGCISVMENILKPLLTIYDSKDWSQKQRSCFFRIYAEASK